MIFIYVLLDDRYKFKVCLWGIPYVGVTLGLIELLSSLNIWAATCAFQQCGILTSVELDKPV